MEVRISEVSYPRFMVLLYVLGRVWYHWRTHQPEPGLVPLNGEEVV